MIGQQGIGRLIVTGTRKVALNVKTGGNPNVAGIDKRSNISVCMDKSRMICNFFMLNTQKGHLQPNPTRKLVEVPSNAKQFT